MGSIPIGRPRRITGWHLLPPSLGGAADRREGAVLRSNPLKAKLRAGRPTIGAWAELADPTVVEILGLAGYDAAVLDHEHGPGGLSQAVHQLQALAATPMAGLLRVPWNDPVYIKRALDIGVDGIMVPSVNSVAEASAAVAACRYPPAGLRGCAAPIVRASSYGLELQRYLQTVEDDLLIICQIETVQAVRAIPEIAAVEGVDMLFIGAVDLSADLGKLGQWDDPEVRDTIGRAEHAILNSSAWLGGLATLDRTPAEAVRDGYHFVAASVDTGLLRDAAVGEITAFRREDGS